MVVRVEMVLMEKKQKGDGGEDGSFVVVVMEFIEGGEVVAGICCRSGCRSGCWRCCWRRGRIFGEKNSERKELDFRAPREEERESNPSDNLLRTS